MTIPTPARGVESRARPTAPVQFGSPTPVAFARSPKGTARAVASNTNGPKGPSLATLRYTIGGGATVQCNTIHSVAMAVATVPHARCDLRSPWGTEAISSHARRDLRSPRSHSTISSHARCDLRSPTHRRPSVLRLGSQDLRSQTTRFWSATRVKHRNAELLSITRS